MNIEEIVISPSLQAVMDKLAATNDLWEIDKLGGLIEILSHFSEYPDRSMALLNDEYNHYHRVLVPAWINKHWGNGIQYNGEDLFHYLYEQNESEFRKYLKLNKYDAQECFVAYHVCSGGPREDGEKEYADGRFVMGFDVFEQEVDDEGHAEGPGWAVFTWDYNTCGGGINVSPIEHYSKDEHGYYNSFFNQDYRYNAKCTICTGKGMFYKYKMSGNHPCESLHDYLGDGGYILRLD